MAKGAVIAHRLASSVAPCKLPPVIHNKRLGYHHMIAKSVCADGEEDGPCLIFTLENWSQPQSVSVRAYGSGQVKHVAVSGDDGYDGLAAPSVRVNGGGTTLDIFLFLPVISR